MLSHMRFLKNSCQKEHMINQVSKCISESSAFKEVILNIIKWIFLEAKKNNDSIGAMNWYECSEFKTYTTEILSILKNEKLNYDIFYDNAFHHPIENDLEDQIKETILTFIEYIEVIFWKEKPTPTSEEILKRFMERVEKGVYEEIIYPIFNLNFSSSPYKSLPWVITDGIEISGLSAETNALLRQYLEQPIYNNILKPYSQFPVLFIKVSKGKVQHPLIKEIVQTIPVLLYGLFNNCTVIPVCFSGIVTPWCAWQNTGSTGSIKESSYSLPINQLSDFDFANLIRFFNTVKYNDVKKFSIAYRRTINSYEKTEYHQREDRVIDVAIAFESLFEGNENISFRLSNIPPLILKDTFEEREKLSSLIKDFYNYRSSIVHGEHQDTRKIKYFADNGVEANLGLIIHTIQQLIRSMLLNPEIRTQKNQKDLVLGAKTNLNRSIEAYLKSLGGS